MINKVWHKILCRFNNHYPLKHTTGANRWGEWRTSTCIHCGTVTRHFFQKKTYIPIYSPELEKGETIADTVDVASDIPPGAIHWGEDKPDGSSTENPPTEA